ncbi:MAG: hypothetical protein NT049_14620 [Planctomycetota bacterium]|nr:hypothetical protein [Planctomycetota bacterium]
MPMTILPPPVVARTNRWAMIAVVASVIALGQIVVAALNCFGIPYRWGDGMHAYQIWTLVVGCFTSLFLLFGVVGLILGTTAVVQCRGSKGAERGLGAAYAAIIIALAALFVPRVIWLIGAVLMLIRSH